MGSIHARKNGKKYSNAASKPVLVSQITKVAVVQKRAEAKDYQDIDAILRHGVDLPTALAAGRVVYGHSFNPLITLKALSFFDDLPGLPADIRKRLLSAVAAVDPTNLPVLTPFYERKNGNGQIL